MLSWFSGWVSISPTSYSLLGHRKTNSSQLREADFGSHSAPGSSKDSLQASQMAQQPEDTEHEGAGCETVFFNGNKLTKYMFGYLVRFGWLFAFVGGPQRTLCFCLILWTVAKSHHFESWEPNRCLFGIYRRIESITGFCTVVREAEFVPSTVSQLSHNQNPGG